MKKLSIIALAAMALNVACDPWEDAPGGDPEILAVTAAGRLVSAIEGTKGDDGVWTIGTSHVVENDANQDGEISDAEAEDSVAAASAGGVPPGSGGNNVIVVTTNKLLDGASIQTAAQNPADSASTGDCRPAGGWLKIQKQGAADATLVDEPLTYDDPATTDKVDDPTTEIDEATLDDYQWYTCYYAGSATSNYGASIEIFRAKVSTAPGFTTTTRPLSVATLSRDTLYVFSGSVKDDSGKDLPINVRVKTGIGASSWLVAFPTSATSATVQWSGVTTATKYEVYRTTEDAEDPTALGGTYTKLGEVATAEYVDATIKGDEGRQYSYFVVAVNDRGARGNQSVEAVVEQAVPNIPIEVSAGALPKSLEAAYGLGGPHTYLYVGWVASNTETYTVERSTTSADGPWEAPITVSAFDAEYVDEDVTPDTTYWYRVKATNYLGETEWSQVAEGKTAKAPVTP